MMGTTEMVREKAQQLPLGHPVSAKTFATYGSRAAVDQALSRLVKDGVLSRPTRGVYLRPRTSPHIGEVPAEPMKVAEAIAAEFGGVVQIHGAEAARRLGFSTQVPARPIFYTSGPNRRFYLGQMEVTLKHVSARKLALAGSMAGVALTALWYLGKDNVSPETIERVRARLAPEEFEALRTATQVMPGWMRDAFADHEGKVPHA